MRTLKLGLVATLAAAACGGPIVATDTVERSFDAAGLQAVVVETYNGAITARPGTGDRLKVEIEKNASGWSVEDAERSLEEIETRVELESGTLRVIVRRADGAGLDNNGASVCLLLPAGVPLELKTDNGPVTVGGLKSAVTARTSNGPIDVENAAGRLDLETSNGPVTLRADAAVLVRARTSNGPVSFTGPLAAGNHVLETSNGGITASLPAQTEFSVDASTSNGHVSCEFPVTTSGGLDEDELSGTVGSDPDVHLRLGTSNGRIEIRELP